MDGKGKGGRGRVHVDSRLHSTYSWHLGIFTPEGSFLGANREMHSACPVVPVPVGISDALHWRCSFSSISTAYCFVYVQRPFRHKMKLLFEYILLSGI